MSDNPLTPEEEMLEYLILQGAVEVVGMDSETNEFLYAITPKIIEIMPEIYDEHMRLINDQIMALWEKGFIDIDFLAEDPMVTITEKAFIPEEINKMSADDKRALEEIKRILHK